MSDISSQISELLSDPGTMEQIKALSGLFGQSAQTTQPPPAPEPQSTNAFDLSNAADMLPAVMKFMPLINAFKGEDDTTRLLYAVKPFLSRERQEKLEQAIKILRIIRIVPLLKDNGLLELF